VVRVLPEVSGLAKEFDYRVPARLADGVDIGTLVRVELHGRRVAAWVTALDVEPPAGVPLRSVTRISSVGPSAEVVDLSRWVAHRWAGRPAAVLRSASPPRAVPSRPPPRPGPGPAVDVDELASRALDGAPVTVVRVGPADDQFRFVATAAARGNALVVCPSVGRARWLAGRLGRAGARVHLQPGAWAGGASGGTVIGARSAVLAPTGPLDAVVVLDEHDESLQEERNPTWHARDVAIERARRAGAPCLLVSPAPSLAGLAAADRVLTVSRSDERRGWAPVEVIDRRDDEPGRTGLFSDRVAEVLRSADRAVAVLNRKGRAAMLACASCGELVRTEDGSRLMVERDGCLVAPETGETRPLVCAVCTGTTLRRLRLGVTRAAEELTHLVGRPVAELTSARGDSGGAAVVLGTEAALHADLAADVVVFLDFDQELHAARYRAAEQAMALLVRASRLVGGRRPGARIVVQTRSPGHRVLRAAVAADPGRMVDEELGLRTGLGFPPARALAEIGGPGSGPFVEPLAGRLDVDVLGPRPDGRYLVRAADPDALADVLAGLERPRERVRVAVDPPRA
jgi:primosomal protein N' (replication factor Y)